MSEIERNAEWAMQELSRPGATFTERVEARKVIGEIVKQADACKGALDRERNYRAALEGVTNTKSIDLAIGIASIALGTNHPPRGQ
jgi:hypothetical protein